jgi:hypothetical protein
VGMEEEVQIPRQCQSRVGSDAGSEPSEAFSLQRPMEYATESGIFGWAIYAKMEEHGEKQTACNLIEVRKCNTGQT